MSCRNDLNGRHEKRIENVCDGEIDDFDRENLLHWIDVRRLRSGNAHFHPIFDYLILLPQKQEYSVTNRKVCFLQKVTV